MSFDISGHVINYKSYELANTMAKGAAFTWDNCCRGLGSFSTSYPCDNPEYNYPCSANWERYQGAKTYNANGLVFDWFNIVNADSSK